MGEERARKRNTKYGKYLFQLFIPFIGIPHKIFKIFVHFKGGLSVV